MDENWISRLKKRWGIYSTFQVIIILVVFACTGFSVLFVEGEIVRLLDLPKGESWWVGALIFIFITLPLYNLILLIYGFLFGQFRFFWNFEKRFFGRMLLWKKKK